MKNNFFVCVCSITIIFYVGCAAKDNYRSEPSNAITLNQPPRNKINFYQKNDLCDGIWDGSRLLAGPVVFLPVLTSVMYNTNCKYICHPDSLGLIADRNYSTINNAVTYPIYIIFSVGFYPVLVWFDSD